LPSVNSLAHNMPKKNRQVARCKQEPLPARDADLATALAESKESADEAQQLEHAIKLSLLIAEEEAACEAQLAQALKESEASLSGTHSPAGEKLATNNTMLAHYTLKVTFDKEVRRLQATWPVLARPGDIFGVIQESVRYGFSSHLASVAYENVIMRYLDDEGDWCVLAEETVMDFLEQNQSQTLKLAVSVAKAVSEHLDTTSLQLSGHQLQGAQAFQIATPPASPRDTSIADNMPRATEDDVESTWSLVDVSVPEAKGDTVLVG